MEGIGCSPVPRPLLALNHQALPNKWTCTWLDSITLTLQLHFLSFSLRAVLTELMKCNWSCLRFKPTSSLPYAWHMWSCCKQPRTKRKKERKWQLLPFQWKGRGNIQPRHCHLQEVKGSLRRLMPKCFHLAIAAASHMVACGQIQAGNISMACWR